MSSFKWGSAKDRPLKKLKEPRVMKMSDSLPGPHEQGKKEETLPLSLSRLPEPPPKEPAPPSKPTEYPLLPSILYNDAFGDPSAKSSPVGGNRPPLLPLRGQPSPPRVYAGPPVPPRSGMVFDSTDTALPVQSMHPSQPLEFIGSKPAVEGRDPSSSQDREKPSQYVPTKGWGHVVANPSLEKKTKAPIERRRSDSQGKATFYRSNSPVSQWGRLSPTKETALPGDRDRQLPPLRRPTSLDSLNEQQQQQQQPQPQQQQSDPAKKESSSILDELMKRYEKKEVQMRKTHEKELHKMQMEHSQTVDRLKEQLLATKTWYAGEADKLKQQRQHMEMNWEKSYAELMQQKKDGDLACKEKEDENAGLRRERDEKDRLVAELKAKCETLDNKSDSQTAMLEALKDDYKNQMADLTKHYESKLWEKEDAHQKAAQQMYRERDVLRKQVAELSARLAAQTEDIKKIKSEKDQLEAGSNLLKKQCNDLTAKYSKEREEAGKREEWLEEEIKKVMDQCARRINEARDEGGKQRDILQERLQTQQESLIHDMEMREAMLRDQMDKMRRDHEERLAAVTLDMRQRILSLESDLIDNGDDMRPSLGGGALQTRYRALKLNVERITEPFNLAEITSSSGFDTSELDQQEFLAREGKGQMRFLLRSVCWSILLDCFFSSPFGFGAFGRGEGKRMLLEVYATWQRLFDPAFTGYISAPELRGQEDFEPFYNDKFANWWRSATFQSIQSVVFPPSRRASQAGKPAEPLDVNWSGRGPQGIIKAFVDNVDEAKRRVLDVIAKVCKVDKVNEAIETEVDDLVRFASMLAVEFGAHGAKICFGMPTTGDTVQIGAEFVDCEDGDANRGKLETVELAVAPSLFMIGDGRKDLTTATCLCPGEIYPRRGD